MTGDFDESDLPTLRELEVFTVLADAPTITDAANTLHLSQSQLSRTLRGLEKRLGTTLFTRSTSGLRLTADGRFFTHTAAVIRSTHTREMRAFASRIAGEAGEIRISVLPSMAFEYMATWVNLFRTRHPQATVTATDDISGSGIAAVVAGEADLAIAAARMRLPSGDEKTLFPAVADVSGVRLIPLLAEKFHLVAPADALIPDSPTWGYALSQLTVGFTESTSVQRSLVSIAAEEGLDYRPETLTNSPLTIAGLVEAGLGWSVVPASNLRLMKVRNLRTAELPGYERIVCVVIPAEDPAPLAQHFVDTLLGE